MLHIAWDYGMVNDAIQEVTGKKVETQKVKTLCQKRVSKDSINNRNANCTSCIRIQAKSVADANRVAKLIGK